MAKAAVPTLEIDQSTDNYQEIQMSRTHREIIAELVSPKMLWVAIAAMFACFLLVAFDVMFRNGCVDTSYYRSTCTNDKPVKLDYVFLLGKNMGNALASSGTPSATVSLNGASISAGEVQYISDSTKAAISKLADGRIVTKKELEELEGQIIGNLQSLDAAISKR